MCVGDYKLGRRVVSVPRFVSVEATATELVSQNNQRVGLQFYIAGTSPVIVAPGELTPAVGSGASTVHTGYPLKFNLINDGNLPTMRWRGITSAGTVVLLVIEQFLPEEALATPPFV